MRNKHKGFSRAIKKLEGKEPEDDFVLKAPGAGFRLRSWYDCVLKYCTGEYSWSDILSGHSCLSRKERQTHSESIILVCSLNSGQMGVLEPYGLAHRKAIKYINSHKECWEQIPIQEDLDGTCSTDNNDDDILRQLADPRYPAFGAVGSPTRTSRTRAEPANLEHNRLRFRFVDNVVWDRIDSES